MFNVLFSTNAYKEFNSLEEKQKKKITEILKVLSFDPIPASLCDIKKLIGLKNSFRIRIGKIRIIYTIIWGNKDIIIARISSRERVYD